MSRWFRFYDCALDDPKVQRLSDRLFKTWINILCIASKDSGNLPGNSDLAFLLRLSEEETANRTAALVDAGLLDEMEHGYEPHNWSKRQFKSDGSTERVRRFRKSERNVSCPVSETAEETGPETETDTERLEIVANPIESAPRVAKRAKPKHEIAADAQPSEADLAYAASEGMTVPVVRIEWPKFRDHHISHGNRMADWPAAWRKWCGNWKGFAPHSRAGPNRKKTMGDLVRDLPLDGRHERTDVFDRSPEAPGTANPSPSGFVGKVPERDRENPGGVLLDLRPALSARG